MQVWQDALELFDAEEIENDPAGEVRGGLKVFFHYTEPEAFKSLASEAVLTRARWASLQAPGGGIRASGREPAARAAGEAGPRCCVPFVVTPSMVVQPEGAAAAEDAWLIRCDNAHKAIKAAAANKERLKRGTLAARQELLGVGHSDTLAAMNDLVFFLEARGKLKEAVGLCRQALQVFQETRGDKDPGTLNEMGNLAHLLDCSGSHSEAEALARKALAGREEVLGSDHPDTLTSVYNLAEVLEARGSLDEAEALFRRELSWCSATYGCRAGQTRASNRNLNRFCETHKRGAHTPRNAARFITSA